MSRSFILSLCLLVPALAAADTVPALQQLGDAGAAIAQDAQTLKDSRTRQEREREMFSLDTTKLPPYVREAIEQKKIALNKNPWGQPITSEANLPTLRTTLAGLQSTIESAYRRVGFSCQAELEQAIEDHRRYNAWASDEMSGIHSATLGLLGKISMGLAADKAEADSLLSRIEADYRLLSEVRSRVRGANDGGVDDLQSKLERENKNLIEADFSAEIQQTLTQTNALAARNHLRRSGDRYDGGKLLLDLTKEEPALEACSGRLESSHEAPWPRWAAPRTVEDFVGYNSCVRVSLRDGRIISGASLLESMAGRGSEIIREPENVYVGMKAAECIPLQATQELLDAIP